MLLEMKVKLHRGYFVLTAQLSLNDASVIVQVDCGG